MKPRGWVTVREDLLREVAPGTGIYAFESPARTFGRGRALHFTFFWPDARRWEGRDFVVAVV